MKLALAISICGLILASGLTSAQTSPDRATVAEQYLLSAANQERITAGLGLLRRDSLLAHAARLHAETMAARGRISHQFAGEPELSARGAAAGVRFSVISENVGEADSAVTLHEMWMRSKGHRENLLDPAIDIAGISVISRGGQLYAVEDFAKSVRTLSLLEQEAVVGNLIAQRGTLVLGSDPDEMATARKTCSMSTGYAGSLQPWFVMRYTADDLGTLPGDLSVRLGSGQYRQAAVGACAASSSGPFTSYSIAVLLYP